MTAGTKAARTPGEAWEEIVPLGYQGSYQRVRAYFRE